MSLHCPLFYRRISLMLRTYRSRRIRHGTAPVNLGSTMRCSSTRTRVSQDWVPQFPSPLPPMQMPPMNYSLPIPHAPLNAPPSRPLTGDIQSQANSTPANMGDMPVTFTTPAQHDPDREEGELTDREGGWPQSPPRPLGKQPGPVNGLGAETRLTQMETGRRRSKSRYSDLEEGEASPDPPSSSRASGSPYNPPMSVTEAFVPGGNINSEALHSISPSAQNAPTEDTLPDAPREPQPLSNHSKSSAQLRIQAKGALLSLAPHNIRFGELAGEGINPALLRQLYEEVGIKVPTPQSAVVARSESTRSSISSDNSKSVSQKPLENHRSDNVEPHTTAGAPVASPVAPSKPMERKELIARMLAAKAARPSAAPLSVPVDAAKDEPSIEGSATVEDPVKAGPSLATPSQEKEVRTKEKNKAQTELARQRIELLKKQGLMRNQQKSQPESVPVDKSEAAAKASGEETLPPLNPATIQHPLPERPPDPDSTGGSRIPGLFMTDSEEASPEPPPTSLQTLQVDPTPQPRATQRKRPRASDFDEPIPVPKKAFSNGTQHIPPEERLIIDISDDDELYDDDGGAMDIDCLIRNQENSVRTFPTTDVSSTQGLSASATPQYASNSDTEQLRKKDLEIQAMHRRIAELEKRNKAKLAASRTQSPYALDSPASRSPESIAAENGAKPIPTSLALHHPPSSFPRRVGSGSAEGSDDMRAKLLRKQELESGIPALDAEIQRTEASLADFRKQEASILSEIAKNREGREQLLEELHQLDLELHGISFEEVEAKLLSSPAKNDAQETDEAPVSEHASSGDATLSRDRLKSPGTGSAVELATVHEQLSSTRAEPVVCEQKTETTIGSANSHRESSPISSSDSTGSAMDESNGSSSESSGSPDPEDARQRTPPLSGAPDQMSEDQDNNDQAKTEGPHPLPERPPLAIDQTAADAVADTTEQVAGFSRDQSSRESSVSEVYEPPEPEGNDSPAGSVYTPPFDPPSPGPVELDEGPRSPSNQLQKADDVLTGKDQGLEVQRPRYHAQVGLLDDNQGQLQHTESKYSPYQSALKNFKAYRYHPKYGDEVSEGFRSLTYSHNIDPMKCLCPFEAAGGVCNDHSCEYQHFRDMSLSEDKVLVQMGSLREGKTSEEKDNYIAGLKQIINDMRRDKVKDFNTVAKEIAAYRRRFLQDPSRILPL
ncbi:hypothetical protein BDW42DRAFT_159145 [Aspergillus taichungensis]|uniref:Putative zinc-finger domain-containing protein n=1 Tax=Aspergillus taichungensis TaxID=482145 RepID=A0A2J5I8M5_9EURO|nr:hypothetical protein BDW42DRAFT_159145 [Aspergillus taichungensis]